MAGRLKLLHQDDDREDVGRGEVRIFAVPRFRAMSRKPRFSSSRINSCLAFIGTDIVLTIDSNAA